MRLMILAWNFAALKIRFLTVAAQLARRDHLPGRDREGAIAAGIFNTFGGPRGSACDCMPGRGLRRLEIEFVLLAMMRPIESFGGFEKLVAPVAGRVFHLRKKSVFFLLRHGLESAGERHILL